MGHRISPDRNSDSGLRRLKWRLHCRLLPWWWLALINLHEREIKHRKMLMPLTIFLASYGSEIEDYWLLRWKKMKKMRNKNRKIHVGAVRSRPVCLGLIEWSNHFSIHMPIELPAVYSFPFLPLPSSLRISTNRRRTTSSSTSPVHGRRLFWQCLHLHLRLPTDVFRGTLLTLCLLSLDLPVLLVRRRSIWPFHAVMFDSVSAIPGCRFSHSIWWKDGGGECKSSVVGYWNWLLQLAKAECWAFSRATDIAIFIS